MQTAAQTIAAAHAQNRDSFSSAPVATVCKRRPPGIAHQRTGIRLGQPAATSFYHCLKAALRRQERGQFRQGVARKAKLTFWVSPPRVTSCLCVP